MCETSAPVNAASGSTFTEQVQDVVQDIEDVGRLISKLHFDKIKYPCE